MIMTELGNDHAGLSLLVVAVMVVVSCDWMVLTDGGGGIRLPLTKFKVSGESGAVRS